MVTEPVSYDGSTLEYLRNTEGFDSILYIIDRIPGLRHELESAHDISVFAFDNSSVRLALESVNNYRKSNQIGYPLSLDSLLVEKFNVVDTVLTKKLEPADPAVIEYDTTFVKRYFDYRLMLDSVMCKYIANENLDFESMAQIGGAYRTTTFRYNQEMSVKATRFDATGAVGLGTRSLELIDLNNSNVESNWVLAATECREVRTRNGIIHFISTNHEFGFNQFLRKFKNRGTEKGVLTYAD